jgi:zinc protease
MRNYRLLPVALLFAVSALAQPTSLPKGLERAASVEGITEYRLANGLRILLSPDASKAKVTVNITYLVGSRHENYGETGMAHLLEHLMFKGTAKHADLAKELMSRGANVNGTTSNDRTNYYEIQNASDENLQWALEMEADRMVNSRIAKSDLESEMTVVRNEYEAGENNPMGVLMKRVHGAAYDWHNYGKTTIGNRSDIENVPIERLQAFYRKYYQPDNAVLVIAGKFDEAKALGWVAEYFGRIPRPERKLEKFYTQEEPQDGERQVTVRRVGDAPAMLAAFHVPGLTHPDSPALEVLSILAGDNPTGRLHRALVDNKKAAYAYSFGMGGPDPGLIYFGAVNGKAQPIEPAKQALLDTIEGLRREPPTAEEVERAKTKYLKVIELTLTNSERVGLTLSEFAAQSDWRLIFLHRDAIGKVTSDDVARVAKKYLVADNRTVGVFVPTDKPERAEIPVAPDVKPMVEAYKGKTALAQGEAFEATPENIDARVRRVTLANGMKVVMLAKKTRGETVLARLQFRAGDPESLKGRNTQMTLAWSQLMQGTTKYSRVELRDRFDKLKAQVSMNSGTVSITTLRPNLAASLELAAHVLREPAYPETELENARQQWLAGIDTQRKEPAAIAGLELARHLMSYPRGDVREIPSLDDQASDVKAVTAAQLKQAHQEFFGGTGDSVIAIVGDFDPEEIEKVLARTLGDWKSPAGYRRAERMHRAAPVVNKSFQTDDKANAMFMAGYNFPLNDEHPDHPALAIANYIFGGSGMASRISQRIRVKEGWSYGAGSFIGAPTKDDGAQMMAQAIANPVNMAKLEKTFFEEVTLALKDGFTAVEVEQAKKAWLDRQKLNRAEDQGLLNGLAGNEYWGRKMSWQADLEKRVASLTAEQVSAAFRQHIKPEGFSVFKAGDFAKAAAAESAK